MPFQIADLMGNVVACISLESIIAVALTVRGRNGQGHTGRHAQTILNQRIKKTHIIARRGQQQNPLQRRQDTLVRFRRYLLYGKTIIQLDIIGCLENLIKGHRRAGGFPDSLSPI